MTNRMFCYKCTNIFGIARPFAFSSAQSRRIFHFITKKYIIPISRITTVT